MNPSVRPSADTNSQCPTCGSNEVIAWEPGRQSRKATGIALIVAAPAVFVSGFFLLALYMLHYMTGGAPIDEIVLFVLLILAALTMLITGICKLATRKRASRCQSCGGWWFPD